MSDVMEKWFVRGAEALERAQRYAEELQEARGPARFFIKPGQTAKVTFLDTEGFGILEHNLKLNGKWGNYYTCLRDFSECPLCDSGDRPSFVVIWTVIDHSKYVSEKTGKIYANVKKLLVAKQSVALKIRRRMASQELGGNLTFATFMFTRDKREEAATGEDVEFVKRLSREDVLKFKPEKVSDSEWLSPFDYKTIFRPKSVDELRKIIGEPAPIGAAVPVPNIDDGLEALL